MSSSAGKCGLNRSKDTVGRERLALCQENEIDQIFDARVGLSIARPSVGVKFLRPVLLNGQRGNSGRCNAHESKPILADNFVEGLDHLITGAEIDMKLHEAATISRASTGKRAPPSGV